MQEIGLKAAIALMQTDTIDSKQHQFIVGFFKVDGSYNLKACTYRDAIKELKEKPTSKAPSRVKYSVYRTRTLQVFDLKKKKYFNLVTDLLVEFNGIRINHYK